MTPWKKKLERKLLQLSTLTAQLRTEKEAHEAISSGLSACLEAQAVAQHVAQQTQNSAHSAISQVVSRCLDAVFDEEIEFRILFERKRGRTEARLVFYQDGEEIDPMSASSGGVKDVAALALRLACLKLSRPQLRRCLILDEPFRFVSPDLRPRVRALLETLTRDLKVQIIMVTHDRELRAGTLVDLGEKG